MKRIRPTLIDIAVVIAVSAVALSIWLPASHSGHPNNFARCRSNLHQVGLLMRFYVDDNNGQYPTTDKWCHLLTKSYFPTADPDLLICPGAIDKITQDSNQSCYVLNKNIVGMKRSEIPADVVLLFEGPVGWNQVGGPELLTMEYHKREGVCVSLADLSVKFVRPDELAELKWK